MDTIYCSNDPHAEQIVRAAYPGATGRKIKIEAARGALNLSSYWSGGSRDYFVVINLATMRQATIPQNGSGFDGETFRVSELPEGFAVIKHTIFQGKDLGFTIILNPANFNQMALPAPIELTVEEKIVLCVTKEYKSNCRLEYSRMNKAKFDEIKQGLIARKFLAKNGAITDEGRNAIGNTRSHSLVGY